MPAIDRFLPAKKPAPIVQFLGLRIGVWVPTCWHYRGRAELCRKKWVPACERLGWQVVFYDEGENTRIMDYRLQKYNLSAKMYRMYELCKRNQYDYVIKADTDTMLWPERFNFAEYVNHDYIGGYNLSPAYDRKFPYAHGGCYILSKRAIHAVVEYPSTYIENNFWAEDEWIGKTMIKNGIKIHAEPRIVWAEPWNEEKFISWHGFGTYTGAKNGCPVIAENERREAI